MTHRFKKLFGGRNQRYFNEKHPVNPGVNGTACVASCFRAPGMLANTPITGYAGWIARIAVSFTIHSVDV
jgi:hypothetical protein